MGLGSKWRQRCKLTECLFQCYNKEFKNELSINIEGMVGFYSQQGVFESIKNVGNIRLALNMKAKKLVVAKTANNINWPSHTLICLMSHTLYFCATSFCRSLHELESKVKTCFKVRLPKKLLAQSGGTNSTIIFTNVINESYSTLITDSLESTPQLKCQLI